MDKYTKTAGLNYLSENSYKGDGSPGMVMGIASDARGDTNTYEAKKPTTSSKHSTERELKKYDPAHGHSKPEGGKPGVCSCITSSGPSTDCAKCGGSGEIITPKRNDPKVDEALEDIMRLSGKERTDEGKMSEIHQAANELSKEEFAKEYPDWVDEYENAQVGPDEDDTVHEADGSGSYGGQSPLTYDTQRSSKMKEEDDQIDEIAKLSGLGEDILSDRKIWVSDSLENDAEEKLKTVSKEDIAMAKAIDPEISGSPFPDMSMIDIINKRVMLIVKKWNDSLLSKDYPFGTTKEDIEQAVYDQIGNYLESGDLNEIEDGLDDINAYRGPAYVEWKKSLGPNADKLIKQAVSMSTNRITDWHTGSNVDRDAMYDRDEYELIDPKLGSGKAEKFGIWADDELNEIAKLSGLGEERKRRPDADDYDDDDWDSDEDEKPEDPDKDRVPHILMQVKKALDVEGDHDIQFENGDKHKFSVSDLNIFLTNYLDMKPEMREKMQEAAITGQEEFENIVSILSPKKK